MQYFTQVFFSSKLLVRACYLPFGEYVSEVLKKVLKLEKKTIYCIQNIIKIYKISKLTHNIAQQQNINTIICVDMKNMTFQFDTWLVLVQVKGWMT